jgi:hypothetical protein
MLWEWRIYYTDTDKNFDPWNSKRLEKNRIVELLSKDNPSGGEDYYYDVKDPVCGLKERGQQTPVRIELKVRLKEENGIEFWEKCMSAQVQEGVNQTDGLDAVTISKYLRDALDKEENKKNPQIEEAIQNTISFISKTDPARVRINKARRFCCGSFDNDIKRWTLQAGRPEPEETDKISIEFTELDFTKQNLKKQSLLSICVEGVDKELVKKFKDENILVDKGKIMGFPEFIMQI